MGLAERADDTARRRDRLCCHIFNKELTIPFFGKIVNAKIAKKAWDILKLSYKGVEKAQKSKLQSLRKEYERYEMSCSESVEQYFSCITGIVNKMMMYGEGIPDNKVVEKILRMIPMKCGDYNN
ncbi:hypothetical protein JHK85_021970 [Glycine max]|uniref:UBN2_2 domain-containing protein n=1 Tax=Glycine max TaxID=3847 RepID=A0A0R0IX15_SOYBN|nr:hypothetical protein JHK85_021970 [Glycine max]KAG5025618.1 hypothetical protein JHK86_021532 [Glycine max]